MIIEKSLYTADCDLHLEALDVDLLRVVVEERFLLLPLSNLLRYCKDKGMEY